MSSMITTFLDDKGWKTGVKSCSTSVQADIAAPQTMVFEHIMPVDLTSIFTGYGPLPAVVGTRDQTGAWDAAGQTRTVIMSDGSSAQEQLTAYEYPNYFSYIVSNFTGVLRAFVTSARGEWWFGPGSETSREVTHIKWIYVFNARSSFSIPIVWFFTRVLWKGYMREALYILKAQVESHGGNYQL